jgi:hypothetical protein
MMQLDELSEILVKQAGFKLDADGNVVVGDAWCTLETKLLIQLVVAWCLEKNRRYLFSHQASQQIVKDFKLELPNEITNTRDKRI